MTPPSLADRILRLLVHPEIAGDAIGDLREEYSRFKTSELGGLRANMWYWRQALGVVSRYGLRRGRSGQSEGMPPGSVRPGGLGDEIAAVIDGLRQTMRRFIKTPGFAALPVITLALGISASTGVFTYINSFSQPFPGVDGGGLLDLYRVTDGNPYGSFSYADVLDFASAEIGALEGVAAVQTGWAASIRHEHMTEVVFGQAVSGNFFPLFGIEMAAGRGLTPEDDRREASPAVVISHQYWQGRFGGASSTVGSTILLNNNPYTIVGVASRDFVGSSASVRPEVWMPLEQYGIVYWARSDIATNRNRAGPQMHVRLSRGASRNRALAEISAIAAGLDADAPLENGTREVSLLPATWIHPSAREAEAPTTRIMLLAAVGLLLLACANVANLLLSIARGRSHEIAVRAAIGASPGRLLRQLLTENLLLSLLAGALALLLANPLASRIGSYFARPSVWGYNVPREVSMDLRVFLFAVGISVIAGLLTGIVPAVRGSRPLVEELKEGGERSVGGGKVSGRRRLPGMRNLMVSAQMAVAVILAILSGLVLRTLDSVRRIEPGFDVDHTVASFMSTSSSGVTVEERQGFYRELALRFEGLSWVRAATVAAQAPLSPHRQRELRIDGQADPVSVTTAQVVPGFFETVGIELGAGRFFALSDTSGTPDVVVINRTMERRYFGGRSALGRQVWQPGQEGEPDRGFEVVGVVEDAKVRDFLADHEPVVYFSYPQHDYTPGNALILSTTIDPRAAVPLLERELRAVDPTLVLVNALPYTEVVRGFQFIQRRNAEIFTAVALLGLALAATGLFSVMSLTVGQRTREIGIRMAIGAHRREIIRPVVGRALVAVAVGVGAGLAISLVTARMIQSLLFGVEPVDPVSIGASTVVLLVVALLASYLPARRALRVDPVVSLRTE